MAGRANARNLQQVRRIDRAAADHDLARRGNPPVNAVLAKRDAGTAPSVEQQPGRDRLGLDPQVLAPPRLGKKGLYRRSAEAPPPRHLGIPDPLLDPAAAIARERKPGLLRGFDKPMGQWQDPAVILDEDRTALALLLPLPRHI